MAPGRQILAAGMVDGPGLIRMALAPSVDHDDAFAAELMADLSDPARGVVTVEARFGPALRDLLRRSGWPADEPWTPCCRDLTAPVEKGALKVQIVDAHGVEDRVALQRGFRCLPDVADFRRPV